MIHESDIKSKDFSIALPAIVARISVITDLVSNGLDERAGVLPKDFFWGLGEILLDVERDLSAINEALYGSNGKEGSEPGTGKKEKGVIS